MEFSHGGAAGLGRVSALYRVSHLLVHLVSEDFNFGCFTVCPILPGLFGIWQMWQCSWARWWNTQIKVNPTQL